MAGEKSMQQKYTLGQQKQFTDIFKQSQDDKQRSFSLSL